MIRYRAAWIVPIATPPLRDGWVVIDRGRVLAVGVGHPADGLTEHDLGHVALMPGLVNAHTHLELSYLREQIPPASSFVSWIRNVVGQRRQRADPRAPEIMQGIDAGIREAFSTGTLLVGDISNTLVTVEALKGSPVGGVVFHELIRFNPPDAEAVVSDAWRQLESLQPSHEVRLALAAHAPYSVSPRVLTAMRRVAASHAGVPISVHLAESREEVEFIANGGGPWREFLHDVGAWNPDWTPHGGSPVAYLDALGFVDRDLLAIHGVQMTDVDLETLRARGATLVTCPRSNVQTGAGIPPVARFYASGVAVAVGTDSLASTPDLNLFTELAALRALAPGVAAGALLDSATRQGARALGFADDFGTIETGKSGRLLAVTLPAAVNDVEECLVGGVSPGQVTWI